MNSIFDPSNYFFNLYALPHFLVGALIAVEGIFVFSQSKKTVTPTAYLIFAITAGVWLMGVGLGCFSSNEATSLIWYRYASWFGIIFVTPAVYLFSASWDGALLKSKKSFIFLNYAVALVFYLICISTSQIVDGLYRYSTGYFPRAGALEAPFIVWFYTLMTLSFVNFVKLHGQEKNPGQKKNIKLMFVAFATGFFGSVEYLPNYGIHIFPAAFLPMLIFTSIMGYCVVRYKLMDIETVIHKTLMWLVSSVVTIFPFALLVHFFHQAFVGLDAAATTVMVTVASFLFYLYYQQIQPRLSRIFQQADQNLQRAFSKFNEELVLLKNLRELIQRSVRLLRRNLYVKAISIYLRDDEKGQLVPVLSKGLRGLKPLSLGDPFIGWLEMSNEVVMADYAAGNPELAEFKTNLADYFSACQARVAVPLVANKKIIGMINLGRKENLRRYSASEIRFLTQLKFPLTIALSNSMQYENVSKLYKQVQHQNDRLKELDRLKSEFLANTSHELRTPLNGILGLVESIIDGADGPLNDSQRRHLQMIIESGANLKELINNLLELSRLESGQMKMNVKAFNVLNVIDVVLALLDGVAKKKNIRLQRIGARNVPDAYGDPEKIQRVLINLVGNAIKFTHAGSVTVDIKEAEEGLIISVEDTGIGISENDQKVIFDRFRQADGSSTRQYEGTGLGLSIAREIVRFHGGDIQVRSEVNKGSVFTFTLPKKNFTVPAGMTAAGASSDFIKTEAAGEIQSKNQDTVHSLQEDPEFTEAVHGNGETVLIIDDNEVNREVVKTRLEIHGYRVIQAADGIEGMEKTAADEPDLIILDLMMPRMSGYDFCKKLRETHSADHLPVIMLTAKTDMGDKIYGLNLGANDYIAKPFNKEELIARVGILIRLRKMTSELKKWNAELEKRVDQRTRELAKTQEQLVQAEKLATIGTLAGGVAHEINNPLTAVLTNAQILKMGANEEDAETIALIEEGAKRCQIIVQKLLKYSRQPQQEPSFTVVSLERVIRSTASMLQYQLLQENVEIRIEQEGSAEIMGIGNELEQVFTNLIVNARDAIRGAGRKGLIQISISEKENDIQVIVADNGIGISSENIKRIFDPFFTTKDVGEGTGLGLAVTQNILQKHHCKTTVESEVGHGAVFILKFPKLEEKAIRI